MFRLLLRTISPVLTLLGLIAIYGYATGQNINDLVNVVFEVIETLLNNIDGLIQGLLSKSYSG